MPENKDDDVHKKESLWKINQPKQGKKQQIFTYKHANEYL